jgi:hemoglobin
VVEVTTLYERVGGEPFFVDLVAAFYEGVASDPSLAPLYPEAPDFSGAQARLAGFLVQYWGGPTTYSDQRGHPRLRMRHAPFPIDGDAARRWLVHMRSAIARCEAGPDERAELLAYIEMAAPAMINRADAG